MSQKLVISCELATSGSSTWLPGVCGADVVIGSSTNAACCLFELGIMPQERISPLLILNPFFGFQSFEEIPTSD